MTVSYMSGFSVRKVSMSLPARLSTEYLKYYGFEPEPNEPHRAKHRRYRSYRTHCSKCGHWVKSAYGDERERLCDVCFRSNNKPPLPEPCSKIYVCCDNDSCPRRESIREVLEQYNTDYLEYCHDGVGGHFIQVKSLPLVDSREKDELLTALFAVADPCLGYLKMKTCSS